MRNAGRMKSLLRSVSWLVGIVLALIFSVAGGLVIFGMITEYRPGPVQPVEMICTSSAEVDTVTLFSLITWNIGYGGLGSGMDFFYDGGSRVRPSAAYFDQTIAGIGEFLRDQGTADFILLQEVDSNSKRSYYLDETTWLAKLLPGYCLAFGKNYDCRFVPMPVRDPMGRVTSGLVTLSRFRAEETSRYGFDKEIGWPDRLFYLKRCFLATRYNLSNGRQLVLVNIHNSAFDTGGAMRKREMEMIREFMTDEYNAGNFLVAGGDWNANPPMFNPDEILTGDKVKQDEFTDLRTFFPDWEFAFDRNQPTNRDVRTAYQHGTTPVTTIDFFLVSPNVEIRQIHTFTTGFRYSDHQPVQLQIALDNSR